MRFRPDELGITVFDRLNAPNTRSTLEALCDHISAAVADVLPGAKTSLVQVGDERRPFRVDVAITGVAQPTAA